MPRRHRHPTPWAAASQLDRLVNRDARPDLRIGDAERTAVTEALQRHYAEGRLDDAELEERLERTLAAKTEADLTAVVHDLPGPRLWSTGPAHPARHPHRPPGPRGRGSRFMATGLLLAAALLVVAVVTGGAALFAVVRIVLLVLLIGLLFRHLRRIWTR